MSAHPTRYILVVEDDDAVRDVLCETLERAGHATRGVRLAAHALPIVAEEPPAAILLDFVMPKGHMSGLEALLGSRRRA